MTGGPPTCRLCGGPNLRPILSLGKMPLANALLTVEQLDHPEPTFPLDLALCEGCALLQLVDSVPPEELFREYVYFSSYSDTMLRHARDLVDRVIVERRLDRTSLVVEVASNDGYLLGNYTRAGIPVFGVEPARNIARVANERGVPTLCEFFGEALGRRLAAEGRTADVVHAHNVLAHVPDPNGFMRGIAEVLKPNGIAVIEVPYVKDMLDRTEFDTIYHEHLCYFSAATVARLARRNGLWLQDAERIPIHGGSLRFFAVHRDAAGTQSRAIEQLLTEEAGWGVSRPDPYERFAASVRSVTRELVAVLTRLKHEGKRLAGYGAAAKGSTLLNYAGVGRELLEFVADRSPHKQNRFMPGIHIPIRPPELLVEAMPDYVVLLAWNFADEILSQQDAYRRRGGRFIIPLPEVTVV